MDLPIHKKQTCKHVNPETGGTLSAIEGLIPPGVLSYIRRRELYYKWCDVRQLSQRKTLEHQGSLLWHCFERIQCSTKVLREMAPSSLQESTIFGIEEAHAWKRSVLRISEGPWCHDVQMCVVCWKPPPCMHQQLVGFCMVSWPREIRRYAFIDLDSLTPHPTPSSFKTSRVFVLRLWV